MWELDKMKDCLKLCLKFEENGVSKVNYNQNVA